MSFLTGRNITLTWWLKKVGGETVFIYHDDKRFNSLGNTFLERSKDCLFHVVFGSRLFFQLDLQKELNFLETWLTDILVSTTPSSAIIANLYCDIFWRFYPRLFCVSDTILPYSAFHFTHVLSSYLLSSYVFSEILISVTSSAVLTVDFVLLLSYM